MELTQVQQEQFEFLLGVWRENIAGFALDVFQSELRPKQIEFCHAFQANKRITFKGGVGFGKTHVMAILVWWSLFTHDRLKVTIFGPTESQLKSGIWNELQSLYGRMPEELRAGWDVTATRISRIENAADCFAEWRTANKDNVASARGIHADNNFILVDEATGVDEIIFVEALQNHLTTDLNPKLCLVSNPKATSGFFYRTWKDDNISDMWTKVHGKMSDNPFVTPEELENATKQYGGVTSNEYRILVEGEFPLQDEDGLISRHLVEMATNNPFAIPSETRMINWGVDPAGPGKDRTVILKRHDNKIIEAPIERRGLTITQLSYLIRDMFQALPQKERDRTQIIVDANGLGRGLADNLKDFGLPVKGIVTQSSPTRKQDFYSRLRDQLWWETKEWFETENVSIPNHAGLIEELCCPTYKYETNGRIKVEGKSDMKKRLRVSPDFADALCLTFAVNESRGNGKYSWSKPIQYSDIRSFE
ncbi:phage terminase large subunit [Agrobacterium rosae]|uniref:phage terminase large subunit n=1 Tax=Agrobacterium rosae TaxID=1972867 RepID=UPI003BA36C1E